MSLSQKVAFNTLVQIGSKATTVVFGLLTTILLTSYLGREGFGDYMYVITLIVLFGGFADWGTATIGTREASKNKKDQNKILTNIFSVRLLLALFGATLMVLTAMFLPLHSSQAMVLRQGIILGSLILVLFATKASFGVIFQTKLVMQKLAIADIAASFSTFLLTWVLISQQVGLLPLLLAVAMGNIVALLIAFYLAQQTIKLSWQWDKVFLISFLKESLPMGMILMIFTIDNKIDTVMLGSLKGSGAVGVYAVAYRIYDVLILGAHYLMASLMPVISEYSNLRRFGNRLSLIYQKAFDILMMMGIGVTILTWVFAPLMVKIITQQRFGEFGDSVLVLRILGLALFLAYFNHLTGYTIVALGRQRPYFWVALSVLIFNVILNLVLIPHFSYVGAATVTVLTETLALMVTSVFIFKILNIVPNLTQFPNTLVQLIKKKGKIF